jgi:betaine reductase
MDPENQGAIKDLVDEHGADNLVVVVGAADPEAREVAAETVTTGDPAYVGPLASPVGASGDAHLRRRGQEQVDRRLRDEVGFLEMTLDTEPVKEAMRRYRSG